MESLPLASHQTEKWPGMTLGTRPIYPPMEFIMTCDQFSPLNVSYVSIICCCQISPDKDESLQSQRGERKEVEIREIIRGRSLSEMRGSEVKMYSDTRTKVVLEPEAIRSYHEKINLTDCSGAVINNVQLAFLIQSHNRPSASQVLQICRHG